MSFYGKKIFFSGFQSVEFLISKSDTTTAPATAMWK